MLQSGGTGEVTEAQRARAAANKAAALARRAAMEKGRPPPPLPPPLPPPPPSTTPRDSSHFVARASVVPTATRCAPRDGPRTTTVISPDRVRRLNFLPTAQEGTFVLLWVQSAQRARHNETLEFAAQRAVHLKKPLVAVFVGTGDFPWANERTLAFMYDGLCELRHALEATRQVQLLGFCGSPGEVILKCATNAVEVVVDGGYTPLLRSWRRHLAQNVRCQTWEVESEVVSPVYSGPGASATRAEKSVASLRPRIWPRLAELASRELVPTALHAETQQLAATPEKAAALLFGNESLRSHFPPQLPFHDGADACLAALDAAHPTGHAVDRSVKRCDGYHRGGELAAHHKAQLFLTKKLEQYASSRNDPGLGLQSHLSPYVHYGQISVIYLTCVAMRLARGEVMSGSSLNSSNDSSTYVPPQPPSAALKRGVDKYLDELVIRRELAVNFVFHERNFDSYLGIPEWARRTLESHAGDARKWTYTLDQFEKCQTHDVFWNACQREIVVSGKMHNYVRMFWCKKIVEWAICPAEAWKIAIHLNNKYGLDGRDPVSYTGVGWCFGLHDKPFPEAQVTGTTRRMSEAGMRSRFRDGVESYVRRWGAGSNGGGKRNAPSNPGGGTTQVTLKEMFAKVRKTV